MNYSIIATSTPANEGVINLKNGTAPFGISKETAATLASPVDIYLSALAACILKNIERFSGMMKFEYVEASIKVLATHCLKLSRLENIIYEVVLISKDGKINMSLLKRNIEKHGTIYYMISQFCSISGEVILKNI